MARLKKGEVPTPVKVRLRQYRDDLERSGGSRLLVDLEKPATDALAAIIERDTPTDATKPLSKKDAVTSALLHYARSRKPARP
ncbi:MAG: hypothetical protein LCH79_16100 [Proteobacteria bacterium]|nr:hypothetical protein [Pseudomonadota bacterium]